MHKAIAAILVPLCLVSEMAFAHHGAFEYDMTTTLQYEGIVLENRWKNPHSLVVLETQGESGETITLVIEAAGPSALRPVGVAADSIVAGERVTAVVNPSRRFPDESAFGLEIIKSDGTVVPLSRRSGYARPSATQRTASTLFGSWSPPWGAFQALIRSRSAWTLTPAGQAVFDSYSPTQSSQAECVPVSAPWLMVHPVVHRIEDAGDHIVIRSDWLGGVERRIYVDDRPHPSRSERFQQGHSTGQWDNGTLVIDTTNFTDRVYAGIASSGDKHLVERLSLADDGKTLNYSFILEDPEYLAEPVSGSFHWDYRPDLEPGNVECDPEIARRFVRELQ